MRKLSLGMLCAILMLLVPNGTAHAGGGGPLHLFATTKKPTNTAAPRDHRLRRRKQLPAASMPRAVPVLTFLPRP
jgi:hypothetical protein